MKRKVISCLTAMGLIVSSLVTGLVPASIQTAAAADTVSYPFTITTDNKLVRSGGLAATINVSPTQGVTTHSGDEAIIFMLMKGDTPVIISGSITDIKNQEQFTTYFNVDSTDTTYKVKAFIFDTFDINLTAPINLAAGVVLNNEDTVPVSYETPAGFDTAKNGVTYGTIKEIQYYSNTTSATRKANVILPAGYDKTKQYPVLYLLHGIGGTHNEWLGGNPQYIIGNLIASGEAPEMIVVMPNCRASTDDSVPANIFSIAHFQAFDNFINDLKNDLMPYIEANYSIQKGRDNTAIAGLSMGGRESLNIGFKMPETFKYIGAFSPAFGILNYTNNGVTEDGLFTENTFKMPDTYNNITSVMIVAGDSDTVVRDEPERYHLTLEKNGTKHIYYERSGGHDFGVWKNALYNFAKKVFR